MSSALKHIHPKSQLLFSVNPKEAQRRQKVAKANKERKLARERDRVNEEHEEKRAIALQDNAYDDSSDCQEVLPDVILG